MHVSRGVATVVTAAFVWGGGLAAAHAGAESGPVTTECAGVLTGSFENVLVKDTGVCHLKNAEVSGSITIKGWASVVIDDSNVAGSITAVGHQTFVALHNTQAGDVSFTGIVGDGIYVGSLFLDNADIGSLAAVGTTEPRIYANQTTFRGNVSLEGPRITLNDSMVQGDLTVRSPKIYSFPTLIRSSKVEGNADLSAEDATICGTYFGKNVKMSGVAPTFGASGPSCWGNEVQGGLTYDVHFLEAYQTEGRFTGNTVFGSATGTNVGGDKSPIKGSSNQFHGGVSGALTAIEDAKAYDIPAPDFRDSRYAAQQTRDKAAHG